VKKILLHHGWTNKRPEGHWLRLTAAELRTKGHQVWYPQFPEPDRPNPADWQTIIGQEAAMMDEVLGGEKIAIAHSLGCLNWMVAAIADSFIEPFDRVLFVAPPDPIKTNEADGIEGEPMNLQNPELLPAIRRHAKSFTIVASDADRWLPRGIEIYEEALQQRAVILPGAGHFSLDDGWGPWQGLLNWVETGNDEALLER
jgi:predicted alpha/beta hydrolase family esterase